MNITTNFQFHALKAEAFSHLFSLDDTALQKMGAIKMMVDQKPGFPCRVSLEDAEVGEEVILLPYEHHTTNSPYRASGAIFIRKMANTADLQMNEIPIMLHHRLLAVRAYDSAGFMKNATVVEGALLNETIQALFGDAKISYLHIHNAKPGCFNCVVERKNRI